MRGQTEKLPPLTERIGCPARPDMPTRRERHHTRINAMEARVHDQYEFGL